MQPACRYCVNRDIWYIAAGSHLKHTAHGVEKHSVGVHDVDTHDVRLRSMGTHSIERAPEERARNGLAENMPPLQQEHFSI